jgi:hypothetical protein
MLVSFCKTNRRSKVQVKFYKQLIINRTIMDVNMQGRELRDFIALHDLAEHIARPCSRDLLRDYLDNLRALVENTPFKEIREGGEAMLVRGEAHYKRLVEADVEPYSSVVK